MTRSDTHTTVPQVFTPVHISRPINFARGFMKRSPKPVALSVCFILLPLTIIGTYVEAQSLKPDTVRFVGKSPCGPTYDLIVHTEQVGLEAFLTEQAGAPMQAYPDLPFWPQTRP